MKSITIRNTKGITDFKFVFPENDGVFLLVGKNGVGKTTLLTCIDRICNPYAFARGFASSRYGSGYDEYRNSEIEYNFDDTCVLFRKKIAKWSATPRKGNAELLKRFGFNESVFVKADSKRIDVTSDEIRAGTRIAADADIVDALNSIFETDKYNNLKKLKVSRGRGRKAAYFNIIKDGNTFYSEKRFSTGELAILRLIESIRDIPNDSLILLDEAEMALHPRVQINLLRYLTQKSLEKELTIFVSTHSPTMIKNTSPQKIMFLDDCGSGIIVKTPCYAATALGGIDYEESKIYDYIFFVEDEMAQLALKNMIPRYYEHDNSIKTAAYTIMPVGGYRETALFAIRSKGQVFRTSKVAALLDQDAFDENEEFILECKRKSAKTIFSLGFTPEVKFVQTLLTADTDFQSNFRGIMRCEIATIKDSREFSSCNSSKPRQLAKDQFAVFITKCCESTGDNEEFIKYQLIKMIVESFPVGEICGVLGPVFNA